MLAPSRSSFALMLGHGMVRYASANTPYKT